MKKWIAVLAGFVLLLTMSGCAAVNAVQKLDAAEDVLEAKLEIAKDQLERHFQETVPPSVFPEAPAEPVQTMPAAPENAAELTKEQAQKIALDHLGITADQVSRMRAEYEIDDGVPQFDIEFHQGDWEYEFEIHAGNGKILSYDKDHKYD